VKRNVSIALAALLLVAAAAVAADHEKEGKIIRMDQDARMMVIQGEKGDQWELYWTETTKLEDGLTIAELRIGDKVEFSFVEREGKKWATEIEREKKAK
jgi:Cu/Ag efflux protein CusF